MRFFSAHPSRLRPLLRALAVAAPLAVAASSASAIASLPTTGTCGFVFTFQYPFAYMYGQSPGTGWGLNVLGTLNFDTKTVSLNVVQMNPALNNTTQQQLSGSGTFTVASGPLPGSYLLTTFDSSQTNTFFNWNVIPVNGGSTLLLQGTPAKKGAGDGGYAGVCQF